jgi:hypothetical protein
MKQFITLLMIGVITSCSSPTQQSESNNTHQRFDNIDSQETAYRRSNKSYLISKGDSIEIPEFEISLSLSTKAEDKLAKDHESVIVMAYFSGRPIDKTPKRYKEIGTMFLCAREIELTDKRVARFSGTKFHKELLPLLADKDIDLLINVWSGRRSNEDNLLSCDLLEDKMSNVIGKTFNLKGKLISE